MPEHDSPAPEPQPEPEPEPETPEREFGAADSEAIELHAAGQRRLDRDLAVELDEAEPRSTPVTTEYLRGLDRRPRLEPLREAEVVLRAQAGDGAARELVIESYLPLIASTARMYRDSPRISRVE